MKCKIQGKWKERVNEVRMKSEGSANEEGRGGGARQGKAMKRFV